jgi:hypothetical protein
MAETEQDPSAVRLYERVRDEVMEHRVVDEAEAAIALAWVGELAETRQAALGQIAALSVAEQVARERLRKAEAAGAPGDLARARAAVAAVRSEHEEGVERFRAMIARVDAELESAESAGLERGRRAERDLERLRNAWTEAYGGGARSPDRG